MLAPMRMAFAVSDPHPSSVDFSSATEVRLHSVQAGDTVSFYKATIAPDARFVAVNWSDGDDNGQVGPRSAAEVVYPDGDGFVTLSHTYRKATSNPLVRITDGLSELRFSGATVRNVYSTTLSLDEFSGAAKLKEVVSVGSRISKVFAPGMFCNTGLTTIPSGYGLPSLSSRKTAPCIPLACFKGCTSLASTAGLPSGAVAIDAYAFEGCSSLSSLSGLSSSPGLVHIGFAAFRGCSSLQSLSGLSGTLTYDSYMTLFGPWDSMAEVLEEMHPGAARGYRVDQFLFGLGACAFENCSSLSDVSDLVVSGGWLLPGTFRGCRSLATIPSGLLAVSVGNDVTYAPSSGSDGIEPGGYRYVTPARTVLSADLTYDPLEGTIAPLYARWADNGGVYDDTAITSLPYSRDIVLGGEFRNCTGLTNVTFASSVKRMAGTAFSGCTALRSVSFQGKTMQEVRQMAAPSFDFSYYGRSYPFGLPSGCEIVCSDGTMTV